MPSYRNKNFLIINLKYGCVKIALAFFCLLTMPALLMAAEANSVDLVPETGKDILIDKNTTIRDINGKFGQIKRTDKDAHNQYTLSIIDSSLAASEVDMPRDNLDASDSTLSSTGSMAVYGLNLDNSSISAQQNLGINGPLTAQTGDNTLTSDRDITSQTEIALSPGATLSLTAKRDVEFHNALHANTLIASSVIPYNASITLENGQFMAEEVFNFFDALTALNLLNMNSDIGTIYVHGPSVIQEGFFKADAANFLSDAAFNNADATIASLQATNFSAAGKTLHLGENGSANISGNLTLQEVESTIANLKVAGQTNITKGSFTGSNITFLDAAILNNVDAAITGLNARDLQAAGNSLKLLGDANSITGNLTLAGVTTRIEGLQIDGDAHVSGGSFTADNLSLKNAFFDNVEADVINITLDGALTLQNNANLATNSAGISSNAVSLDSSRLHLTGDFNTPNLAMRNSSLDVSGILNVDMPEFHLNGSAVTAGNATFADIFSSGDSSITSSSDIHAGNLEALYGRLALAANTGQIIAQDARLQAGSALSLQAVTSQLSSLAGNGDFEAHNLHVLNDMSLANGTLALTGQAAIDKNFSLKNVSATVQDLTVKGMASLSASALSGRDVTLEQGASLDQGSRLEAQKLTSGANITLYDNAELLASEISLGQNHLVLDGAAGEMVAAAVGTFGSGDLTVDANSLLSIGAKTPNWVNMGMQGHQASAALGLWTPFQLAQGAYAAVGAGMSSRARNGRNPGGIAFGSDSLLITNATVASEHGAGAFSSQTRVTADVEAGAKLHILGATDHGLYRVLGENITVNYQGDAWEGKNVKSDDVRIMLDRLDGDKLGWFRARKASWSLDPDLDNGMNVWPERPTPDTSVTPPPNTGGDNPGTTPDKPSQPDTPTTPDKPTTPDNPGTTPGNPSQPDTPGKPDTPTTPDEPTNPGNPGGDNPGTTPGNPSQPDTPTTPDEPTNPGNPGGDNSNPGGDNPTNPDKPSQPDKPDEPDNPDTPDEPTSPDNPDQPNEPENPDEPDTDEPAEPENPEEPDDEPGAPEQVEDWQTRGQVFLSKALSFWVMGHDVELAARTIESAARIFALGAVPELTVAANQAGSAAMAQRAPTGSNAGIYLSKSNGELLEPGENWHGFAMWVSPLYKSVNGQSLTSGNYDVDVNGGLGGIALGGDYTFANDLRLGLSFNIGGGYAKGGGDLADTTNNMSFWGVGAYGGWSKNNFDVFADVAFTSTYNKLRQELPWMMGMDDLKSDITAWALSAGLELGYTLQTDYLDIRPHVGARYTCLYNDSYDVNSDGTVLEGKAKGRDFWSFPAGVMLDKEIHMDNGWHLRPYIDFVVTPVAGETKTYSEVRFTGLDNHATLKDQFLDNITYGGSAGIEFGAGPLVFGIDYTMRAGVKTTSHAVMGTFAYTF